MESVGSNDADPGAGVGKHAGLRPFLHGLVPRHYDVRVIDLDTDATDSPDPQGLPP